MQRRPPLFPLFAALAIIGLLFCWNLGDPFLSDDYILISRTSLDPRIVAGYFTHAGGDGSFRPIGYLYHAFVGHLAGLVSWKWHLCGLIVHLLNCALLYILTWTIWSDRAISFNTTLLFGLHGTNPEVVTWTAGNFDSLASCFVLAAHVIAFRSRNKPPSLLSLMLIAVFLALAVASKESAYAAPFLLLGFAWAAGQLERPAIRWAAACSLAVCAALFVYRWALFGGPGGYLDPTTGRPAIFSLGLVSSAKALLLRLWAILLFPMNWEAGASWSMAVGAGLLCAAFLYLASGADHKRRNVYLALLVTTACALLPALPLALIGSSELNSRILYLPSVGFAVLCAHLVAASRPRSRQLITQTALFLGMSIILANNLRAWHQTAVIADQFCSEIAAGNANPSNFRAAPVVHGVFFFANGLEQCVALKRQTAARPR